MKLLLSICLMLTLGSCAGGWTDEDKRIFKKDCKEAVGSQINDQQKETYCQCFTDEMVKMYPVFNDAMEHHDSAKLEAAKAHCRREIGMP